MNLLEKISYVIPCYGSEKTIEVVVDEITTTMKSNNSTYEIILVNDNSPDRVWDVIQKLAENDEHIIGIDLAKNFGQHAALMAGYQQASGDVVVSLDDDGQTPAIESMRLIERLLEGYDVVFAEYETIRQNSFRVWGSHINEKMAEALVNKPKDIKATSFYVARKFVIDEILKYSHCYPYIGGLIYRTTLNIGNVKVQHRERMYGKSGYNLRKLLKLWINGFTAFSVKPLRVATVLGIICAILGGGFAVYGIIRKLMVPTVPMGYTSIITILLVVGGIIMMLLGMIGEYVGRIYLCINTSPQYVIRQVTKRENQS